MKNLIIYTCALFACLTLNMHAQDDNSSMQKAIEQGQADLIEVLATTGKDFDFGIDAEEVKSAKPASGMAFKEMNLEKLMQYEDGQGIYTILSETQKFIVPLVDNNRVVATIGVSDTGKGSFQVTELINRQYQDELNLLPQSAKQNKFQNLNIVYVPNLNTTVYLVNGKTYTSYKGRSLREEQITEALMQEMKLDAKVFQEKYGDLIKQGKLLN